MSRRLNLAHRRQVGLRLVAVLIGAATLAMSASGASAAGISAVESAPAVGVNLQAEPVEPAELSDPDGEATAAARPATSDAVAAEATEPEVPDAPSAAGEGSSTPAVASAESSGAAARSLVASLTLGTPAVASAKASPLAGPTPGPTPDTTVEGTVDALSGAPLTDFTISAVAIMDDGGSLIATPAPVTIVVYADGTFIFPAVTNWVYQLEIVKAGKLMPLTSTLGPYWPGVPDPTRPVPENYGTTWQIEVDGGIKEFHITIIDAEILTWTGLEPLGREYDWGQGLSRQTAGREASVGFTLVRPEAVVQMGDISSFDPMDIDWFELTPVKGSDGQWRMDDILTEAKPYRITVWVHYEGAIFRYGFLAAVEPAGIVSAVILPERDEIVAGETVCFSITGKDEFGNEVSVAPATGATGLSTSRDGDISRFDQNKSQLCTTFGEGDGTHRTITYTHPKGGVVATTAVRVRPGLALTGPGRDIGPVAAGAAGLVVLGAGLIVVPRRSRAS